MARYALNLPVALKQEAELVAKQQGVSLNQFIQWAVAEKVGQLLREYQYGEHLVPGHTSNYHLASKLGITNYLLDRFTIAGTPEDCRARVAALRDVGVCNLCLSFSGGPDPALYVRRFGAEVLPAFEHE